MNGTLVLAWKFLGGLAGTCDVELRCVRLASGTTARLPKCITAPRKHKLPCPNSQPHYLTIALRGKNFAGC
jgi:hypothetical protein